MKMSTEVDKIAPALLAAQTVMPPVVKSADNSFFKSRYAPLDVVMDAAQKACGANGIFISQAVTEANREGFILETTLLHSSGQWISGGLWFPNPEEHRKEKGSDIVSYGPPTPQGTGSASTYARRYSLSAILGIVADEDDDGEFTAGRERPHVDSRGDIHTVSNKPTPGTLAAKAQAAVPKMVTHTAAGIPKECPQCGGPVWDNHVNKKTPTAPDWRCRNNDCKTGKYTTAGWIDRPDPLKEVPDLHGDVPLDESQAEY